MRVLGALITLLFMAGAGTLWAPSAARAGGYDVPACASGIAGGVNNAFYSVTSPGMAAYAECPAGQGITVRNAWDNGQSGWLDGGYMIFDAPNGNLVESISYEAGYQRHDCSWSLRLIASGYDLGGTPIWGLPPGGDCTALETPGPTSFFSYRWDYAVNAPRVRIESRCGAGACPRNGLATLRLRNVQVRVRDDVSPGLAGGRGALWTSNAWLSGVHAVGFDAHDSAGIREVAIHVDDAEVGQRGMACDFTRPAPCPSGAIDRTLNTVAFGGDGVHTIRLSAVDAGGNRTVSSRTVRTDNTPPDAPKSLTIDGGDGWRARNEFDVRWQLDPSRTGSPIAGVEYEICPTVDKDPCVRGSRDGRDIVALDDVKVSGPGTHKLRVWLRDEAGNQDRRLAAPEQMLRYDDASPELAFEALSAEDPTRLTVATNDRGSGVVAGQIEMRRRGAQAWATLPTVVEGSALVARLDDEHLGDGVFDMRARAVDAAGNERSTDRRADGQLAEVTLPVRLKTSIRGGIVRRRHGRTTLARTARVGYGRVVRVRGRLLSEEGNPLQGFHVQAYTQIRDGSAPPKLVANAQTSRTGRFTFLVRRGPNRTIRLRYPGAAQIRSATRVVVLNVRAKTTIRPNRRSFSNGQEVRFRGRVRTGRIPQTGKLVELQVRVRGRWRTFATTRTNLRGTWRYRYRFDGTTRRTVYRFRARVPREAGYPFVTGNSRVVRVGVRGV